MNKKAFTLIELLAVIVILAIISLIAVPIVINIINDSKTSSDEQSVELYLDNVKKTIAKKQLNNPNFNPDKCKILSNGDLECYKDNNKIETLQIDVKGKEPEKGIIEIQNSKFKYKNIWFNGKKYYAIAILVDDADNNGEISIGDKYTYKVNDTDKFNFYVLSINQDNTVNLIMDRNICEDGKVNYTSENNYCDYKWYDDGDTNIHNDINSKGPVTAITKMYNATKDWINVPDMDLSGTNVYEDEGHKLNQSNGYGEIGTTEKGIYITDKDVRVDDIKDSQTPTIIYDSNKALKARLPKYSEVSSSNVRCYLGYTSGNYYGSCSSYMVENLLYYSVANNKYSANQNNGISNIIGYWLLSSGYFNGIKALFVRGVGRSEYINVSNPQDNIKIGIRPVITVPIDDLN